MINIYQINHTAQYTSPKDSRMGFAVSTKKILFIMDVQIIEKKNMRLEFYGMTKILKLNGQLKNQYYQIKTLKIFLLKNTVKILF